MVKQNITPSEPEQQQPEPQPQPQPQERPDLVAPYSRLSRIKSAARNALLPFIASGAIAGVATEYAAKSARDAVLDPNIPDEEELADIEARDQEIDTRTAERSREIDEIIQRLEGMQDELSLETARQVAELRDLNLSIETLINSLANYAPGQVTILGQDIINLQEIIRNAAELGIIDSMDQGLDQIEGSVKEIAIFAIHLKEAVYDRIYDMAQLTLESYDLANTAYNEVRKWMNFKSAVIKASERFSVPYNIAFVLLLGFFYRRVKWLIELKQNSGTMSQAELQRITKIQAEEIHAQREFFDSYKADADRAIAKANEKSNAALRNLQAAMNTLSQRDPNLARELSAVIDSTNEDMAAADYDAALAGIRGDTDANLAEAEAEVPAKQEQEA